MPKTSIAIHGLKACDSTRAAMKALRSEGAVLVDLRETPVPRAVLAAWLERLGPGLLNRASATWRGLGEAERQEDPLDLMDRHPALIKRPVIVAGDRVTLGWSPAVRIDWMGEVSG
jgi:arsenate reductase-like glutaredoxin family protein